MSLENFQGSTCCRDPERSNTGFTWCINLVMAGQCAWRTIHPFGAGFIAAAVFLAGCQQTPTFNQQIAPIVFKNCAPCHRPGEAGPFPLLTYDDVVKKARTIAAVTQARYMPPWPADPNYSHFLGERVLRNEDI